MHERNWTTHDMTDQRDRTVLITGANSGLGLSSAIELASHGAKVIMACRDPGRGAEALERVKGVATGGSPILVQLDLADLDSVERAAAQLHDETDRIDVAMNNAGVMALPLRRTAQGHEMQFGTNHLGHFALTGRVLDLLHRAEGPRVVTTSSQAHRFGRIRWDDLDWSTGYKKWSAYGQSKLANLLFTYELDRRARSAGSPLVSMSAHPGYASTHLQAAGPELAGNRIMATIMSAGGDLIAQSADMGALPQLYAATSPDAVGGAYYGPDGVGEMRGHPRLTQSSKSSLSTEDWRRLWERSEELTGVGYDWP